MMRGWTGWEASDDNINVEEKEEEEKEKKKEGFSKQCVVRHC